MGLLFIRLPTSFLPAEDQGWMLVFVQAPVGATAIRTNQVLDKVQDHFLKTESKTVESVFTVQGFSFSGSGQNAGIGFILLKDWSKRPHADQSVAAVAGRAWGPFSQIKDGLVFPIIPPAVTELGTSAGFDFYLKDEGGQGPRGAHRRAQPAARHGDEGQAPDRHAAGWFGRLAPVPARYRRRARQRARRVDGCRERDPGARLGRALHR